MSKAIHIIKPRITTGELIRHLKKLPKDTPISVQAYGGGGTHEIPIEAVVYFDKDQTLCFTNMSNSKIPYPFLRVDAQGEARPLLAIDKKEDDDV